MSLFITKFYFLNFLFDFGVGYIKITDKEESSILLLDEPILILKSIFAPLCRKMVVGRTE